LARIPTARTVGNWLRQFTQTTLAPLVQLNHDLVIDAVTRLALPRLTIDPNAGTSRGRRLHAEVRRSAVDRGIHFLVC